MTNVVWIVLDCVREDYLGCCGNETVFTPTIDSLAERGVTFDNHVTAAPWTNPSVTSMLTGIYPHNLQIFRFREKFPPEVNTIYHHLDDAEYQISTFTVSEGWFGENDFVNERGLSRDIDSVLNTIEEFQDDDFFLFTHYWNTHLPYFDKFSKEAWFDARDEIVELIRQDDNQSLRKAKNLYRAAIERASEEFMYAIVEKLGAVDVLEDTYIVITGDHGESWGGRLEDRSEVTVFGMHGKHLYEEVLRVPLIIFGPDIPKGERVDSLTRSIDVMPTILDLVGLGEKRELDGESLTPAFSGGEVDDRPIVASTTYIDNPDEEVDDVISKMCYRDGRWKLIQNFVVDEYADAEYELYDLESDPKEQDNLAQERPELRRELQSKLDGEAGSIDPADTDDQIIRERLEELGYL